MSDASRRLFLLQGARLSAALAGASLTHHAVAGSTYPFSLGVASGSPLPDSVILWTRILADPLDAAPPSALALSVRWEVAEDEAFRRIAAKGTASAVPALAHSVHVDVKGLQPDRWYWYRFMLGDAVSPVGRTRTAPQADAQPQRLRMAVASCQHWEFGSYGAHRHIAASAPDLVAFLGDYIYEWGPYQLRHPARAVRSHESFTLDEYRRRYAQYKSDPDLQAAHHAAPWIVTWDDHEVANDYANLRDERLAGDFAARRAAAYQAFYEHMPLRLPNVRRDGFAAMRLHQRYDWGRLARIHVLDDRQYRAVQACSKQGRGGSNAFYARDCKALRDPGRSMLGREQETWLDAGLKSSRVQWNILAQQTLMAQSSSTKVVKEGDNRVWSDGWDGYPLARRKLLESLQASQARNPLVLGGDVHTFYACELRPDFARPVSKRNPVVASEFCGTSITSSSRPQERTLAHVANNPHMLYGRSDKRGYMLLEVTPQKTVTQFLGLDDVRDPRSKIATLAAFNVTNGKAGPQRM
ncbi:alkaline phosphatase [Massilia sp. YIM B02443]|uniref:alkaline phosphatase D family protein n=1 Tax=Massilia sp. YIM B02443 TaxID=3050127 RepID=UPI0025B708A3|nr:alkaline phosphatase D family protein [Massilia sp. YIM B02443]MDN4037393.1 alkaline phosphatase D family protein [Massilia sp. YIM B02443]